MRDPVTNSRPSGPRRECGRHLPVTARAALLVLAALLPLVAPPASAADPVIEAEAQVEAMNAKVAEVGKRLEEGTRRWEQGTRQLRDLELRSAQARREADAASRELERTRASLRALVASMWRNPAPDLLLAAVASPDGESFRGAVLARSDLQQARGSQQATLLRATAQQVRLRTLVSAADTLERDARTKARALAKDLDALTALAERTDRELRAANERLADLERAARERAAAQAARLARERASRSRASTAKSCSGAPVGGYSNGNIPESALCALSYAPGHRQRADAAAAFNKLTEFAKADRGAPLCVTDSYRSYSEQVALYRRKPRLAATPGTSNHGWGIAVDLCGGVERFGSDAYQWMKANAPRFGWVHPAWAEPGGSRPEAWHWEFAG
jgi:hypothetical protein